MTPLSFPTISSYTTLMKESLLPRLKGLLEHRIAKIALGAFVCLAGLAFGYMCNRKYLGHRWETAFKLEQEGIALVQQGKLNEALLKFRASLSINSNTISHILSVACDLRQNGKLDEAEKIYEEILAVYPQDRWVQLEHAKLLKIKGKLDEAAKKYQNLRPDSMLSSFSWHERVNLEYCASLRLQGKQDEAKSVEDTYLEELKTKLNLDKDPNNTESLNCYAQVLPRVGKFAEAEKIYEEILAVKPSDTQTLSNYGTLLRTQGELDEAAKIFEEIFSSPSPTAVSMVQLSEILIEQGKFDEEEAKYEEWLVICTKHPSVKKDYALMLRLMDQEDEAEHFEDECKAREKSPG